MFNIELTFTYDRYNSTTNSARYGHVTCAKFDQMARVLHKI